CVTVCLPCCHVRVPPQRLRRALLFESIRFLLVVLRRPPRCPLFPYTTLFRSLVSMTVSTLLWADLSNHYVWTTLVVTILFGAIRSEEHTSELQSRENLVCRLLLEKKKQREQHEVATQPQPPRQRPSKHTEGID